MESLHKYIQLMLGVLQATFLIPHFSCYTLMTFRTMLSVTLLSMLMILFFILSVPRHPICGNNLNWLNGTQLRSVGVLSRSLWGSVRVSGAQRGSVGPVGLSAQCKYTSLYRLIHLFDWRRGLHTTLYTLSSHYMQGKNLSYKHIFFKYY